RHPILPSVKVNRPVRHGGNSACSRGQGAFAEFRSGWKKGGVGGVTRRVGGARAVHGTVLALGGGATPTGHERPTDVRLAGSGRIPSEHGRMNLCDPASRERERLGIAPGG